MSLRQLRTRIEHLEHLEAKSPEPVNDKKRSASADCKPSALVGQNELIA
jgi:hypothetical protein